MRARPSPPAAAGFVGQSLYPVLQKPLRPFVDKAPSDPHHRGDLEHGQTISQQEKNPPTPGVSCRDGGRALPRRQRLALVSRETDHEGGFPSPRHSDPRSGVMRGPPGVGPRPFPPADLLAFGGRRQRRPAPTTGFVGQPFYPVL